MHSAYPASPLASGTPGFPGRRQLRAQEPSIVGHSPAEARPVRGVAERLGGERRVAEPARQVRERVERQACRDLAISARSSISRDELPADVAGEPELEA